MEVTNRFKGLDLIDRVPEELWTEVRNIVQEAVSKTIPKKKKSKKARILKWFATPFSSGPHFVRTLHHDMSQDVRVNALVELKK